MVSNETDEDYNEEPDVVKTFVANETIDGHPTEKYQITVTYQGRGNPGGIYLERH